MEFEDARDFFVDIEGGEILTPTEKGEFAHSKRKTAKDGGDLKVNIVHKDFYNDFGDDYDDTDF